MTGFLFRKGRGGSLELEDQLEVTEVQQEVQVAWLKLGTPKEWREVGLR